MNPAINLAMTTEALNRVYALDVRELQQQAKAEQERGDKLEAENADLKRQLAEAKKPKPRAKRR